MLVAVGALVVFVITGGLRPVAVSIVSIGGAFGLLAVGIVRSSRPPEGHDQG